MSAPRQGDLFGHDGQDPSDEDFETPVYYPDPNKVREELHKISGRGAGSALDALGRQTRRALSHHLPANDRLPARR